MRGSVRLAGLFLAAALAFGLAEDTFYAALARLASALSRNDAPAVLAVFDRTMQDYGAVEASLQALTSQTDVLCAIEVVEEKVSAGPERVLDTDWYMQMKPRGEGGESVRRRERVTVTLRQQKGTWVITRISPVSVLAPINIR